MSVVELKEDFHIQTNFITFIRYGEYYDYNTPKQLLWGIQFSTPQNTETVKYATKEEMLSKYNEILTAMKTK